MKNLGSIVTVRAKQLLQLLEERGHRTDELAERAGLATQGPISKRETIPLEKMVELYEEAAVLSGDNLIGFKFGQNRDARDMGLLGFISVASPTVLMFFENSIRYQKIIGSAMRFDTSLLRDHGVFQWPGEPKEAMQYWEYHTANCLNQLRTATGQHIKPISVGFTHDRQTGCDEINAYLGCEASWNSSRNFLRFETSDLKLTLRSSDNRLLDVLSQSAEHALELISKTAPNSLNEIRKVIVRQTSRGRPTSASVASDLGISDRTLSRRLADERTDFRTLLDETREALAREYLSNMDLNLRDVAYLLGFSDASSFSAACRRWTGQAPSELREMIAVASKPEIVQGKDTVALSEN